MKIDTKKLIKRKKPTNMGKITLYMSLSQWKIMMKTCDKLGISASSTVNSLIGEFLQQVKR